jgi:hypothetical protein
MASKSTKSKAYEMLVTQKDAITRITGIIIPESIDGLENELGGAFTKLKSAQFAEGQRYGFIATVIPQDKYPIVISDAAGVYAAPVDPGAYAATALAPGVSAAQQEQLIAQHKVEQTEKREKNYSSTEWATTCLNL